MSIINKPNKYEVQVVAFEPRCSHLILTSILGSSSARPTHHRSPRSSSRGPLDRPGRWSGGPRSAAAGRRGAGRCPAPWHRAARRGWSLGAGDVCERTRRTAHDGREKGVGNDVGSDGKIPSLGIWVGVLGYVI